MSENDVFVDITELFGLPLHTGIQRVERELIRHWPGPRRLTLCIYDQTYDALRILPDEAASILIAKRDASRLAIAEERSALYDLLGDDTPTFVPSSGGVVLNPELFFDPARARFYEHMMQQDHVDVFWLVYDFLPYLEPDWFEQGTSAHGMPYVRALRSIPNVAFISERTRQDYLRRIMRSSVRDGPVISLGGDGLGLEAQHFTPERRGYVVLGSIEPRKRLAAVLEAFAMLWSNGSDATLTVIGRLLPHAHREIALLESLKNQTRLRHLNEASDAAVREVLRHTRALIFASEGEGFGLPPFESLFCGIPAIVGPAVPSIEMLPADGQIRLPSISPDNIAAAIRRLGDNESAAELWRAAACLTIPTWRDFTSALASWVHQNAR